MTLRNHIAFVTVVQSAVVSGEINIAGIDAVGIFAPVITSAQAFVQVAPGRTAPASADYVRLRNPDFAVNSQLAWNVGPGSEAAVFPQLGPFAFARVELGVAQADVRTLTIVAEKR